MKRNTELSQYFTPTWAAELLVKNFFPELNANSRVIEPSCGDGRFLMALPGKCRPLAWTLIRALPRKRGATPGARL